MTDPGHASDHGDRRAPGNMLGSACSETIKGRGAAGAENIRSITIKMSKLRALPIFRDYSNVTGRLGLGPRN